MSKEWKMLEGTGGRYKVSSIGEILNVSTGKTLNANIDAYGYTHVRVAINGKPFRCLPPNDFKDKKWIKLVSHHTAKSSALKTNTMKTKEECLLECDIKEMLTELQRFKMYKAMDIYSDQKNKEKDAEIQRLTKEVEGWKLAATNYAHLEELTRLRELLGRMGGWARHYAECSSMNNGGGYCNCGLSTFLTEISNALNHKQLNPKIK